MYHGAQAEPEPVLQQAPAAGTLDAAGGGGSGYGGSDAPMTQEDAWAVISSYFETKGLVAQQLDSYNEFTSNTMQVGVCLA
jgi:DNA-directed RNA polymerase beta subunit